VSVFQPPTDAGRYRNCRRCGALIDRSARVCERCKEIVSRVHGSPFDEMVEETGRSIEDCRHALSLSDGDVDAAIELLANGVEA
jgi:hypothetical protein